MARPRTPTALLELRDAFKRNPNRLKARQGEPLVTPPLPDPPDYLTAEVATAWQEMKARGHWLKSADRFLVEIAATLTARYRLNQLQHGHVSVLIALLGKLGLLPQRLTGYIFSKAGEDYEIAICEHDEERTVSAGEIAAWVPSGDEDEPVWN